MEMRRLIGFTNLLGVMLLFLVFINKAVAPDISSPKYFPQDGENWTWIEVPNSLQVYVHACDFISANDGWVGGENGILTHWDGSQWTEFQNPGREDSLDPFFDVSMLSSNDAWTIRYLSGDILHWNGRDWIKVKYPRPYISWYNFSNLTFVEPDLGFVSGVIQRDKSDLTGFDKRFVLRWNGTQFTVEPFQGNWKLDAIKLTSRDDGWAVADGIMYRWNGQKWGVFPPLSKPQSLFEKIYEITAIDPDDVWAVGRNSFFARNSNPNIGIIIHWDGNAWHEVYTSPYEIYSIKMFSPNEGWALARLLNERGIPVSYTLLHYTQGHWVECPFSTKVQLNKICGSDISNTWIFGGIGKNVKQDYIYTTTLLHLQRLPKPTPTATFLPTRTNMVLPSLTPTPLIQFTSISPTENLTNPKPSSNSQHLGLIIAALIIAVILALLLFLRRK
jgi:hypothetical protein